MSVEAGNKTSVICRYTKTYEYAIRITNYSSQISGHGTDKGVGSNAYI